MEVHEKEDPNVIWQKDQQFREAIRWQVSGASKIFNEGLEPTDRSQIKRAIFEEHQIITTTFYEYPEIERRFNEYHLQWMSRPLGSYQPNFVQEFFADYLAC